MNNKFLQQIFSEKDFSEDYELFLTHFQQIMAEDNDKKIKYLAELLTVNKEGKVKSVEMVRRLPWTSIILDKVAKISRELLKHSGPKWSDIRTIYKVKISIILFLSNLHSSQSLWSSFTSFTSFPSSALTIYSSFSQLIAGLLSFLVSKTFSGSFTSWSFISFWVLLFTLLTTSSFHFVKVSSVNLFFLPLILFSGV